MSLAVILGPLRHQRFRRMWIGQALSTVGDGVYLVALVSALLARPHDSDLGYALGAESAASVCIALFAGVVADRFRRTRVMVVADAVRVVAAVSFALIASSVRETPLVVLLLLSAAMGAGAALFRPAYGAVLPGLVPPDDIAAANALRSMTSRVAAMAGPAIGGVVVALFGVTTAFWVDAATFAVSIVTLVGIAEPVRDRVTEAGRTVLTEAKEGFRAVLDRPWVAAVIGQGTIQLVLAMAPAIVLLPLVLEARGQTSAYGLLLAAQALGALMGGLTAASWKTREPGTAGVLGLALMVLQLGCFVVPVPIVVLGAAMTATGFGYSIFGVLWMTALQRNVPDAVLGRVLAVEMVGTYALEPVGLALAPLAAASFGIGAVVAVGIVTMAVTTVVPLFVPGVREFADRPPAVAPREAEGVRG